MPTRRLLRGRPDAPVVAVPDTATVLEACEFFALHELLAFPEVDAERRLVGLVDVDLYTDGLADLELRREGASCSSSLASA